MSGSCFGYKLDDLLQSVQVMRADMRVSRRASETAQQRWGKAWRIKDRHCDYHPQYLPAWGGKSRESMLVRDVRDESVLLVVQNFISWTISSPDGFSR